jgi:hypothetical protein
MWGDPMTRHAEFSAREQAKLYLEWAECARSDAVRAVGRDARHSYLAAAEQWDAQAVDIKLKLWRGGGVQAARRTIVLDRSALNTTERYKREAKRPRTPGPAVPIRSGQPLAPAELHV